ALDLEAVLSYRFKAGAARDEKNIVARRRQPRAEISADGARRHCRNSHCPLPCMRRGYSAAARRNQAGKKPPCVARTRGKIGTVGTIKHRSGMGSCLTDATRESRLRRFVRVSAACELRAERSRCSLRGSLTRWCHRNLLVQGC